MKQEVMIIDDEEFNRLAISFTVTRAGMNALAFETPSQAQDYLTQNQVTPLAYLVDMRIPCELNGSEELFNYIKQRFPTENFYFMTGHLSEHDNEVLARTGAKYVLKGGGDDLIDLIKRLALEART